MKRFKKIGNIVICIAVLFIGSCVIFAASGNTPYRGNGVPPQNMEVPIPPSEIVDIPIIEPRKIIGADDRSVVNNTSSYPYRAIANLAVHFPNYGPNEYVWLTGFFVSESTVVTSGHCLYDSSVGGKADKVLVYAGRNGSNTPFYATGTEVYVPDKYKTSSSDNYDYGLVNLSTKLGSAVGWFGTDTSTSIYDTQTMTISGYPIEKSKQQWKATGKVTMNESLLDYSIDTTPGQSGSPIFYSGSDGYYVVGIHCGSYDDYNNNWGVRLSTTVKNWINNNKK